MRVLGPHRVAISGWVLGGGSGLQQAVRDIVRGDGFCRGDGLRTVWVGVIIMVLNSYYSKIIIQYTQECIIIRRKYRTHYRLR